MTIPTRGACRVLFGTLALVEVASHVPTYGGCVENCCTPPRIHTTSQVIYMKGSGGLEIHLLTETDPIDTVGGVLLDVDAVFRDEIDQTTYSLYIGCGGCVPSEDEIVISPLGLDGYEPVDVEPFTQTAYRSVFSMEERKFNSTQLARAECPEAHFTIRLVDYENRTGEHVGPIVWAPVIGIGETFTFIELLEFPLYILNNHGASWNEMGYTYWLWLFFGTPVVLGATVWALRAAGAPIPPLQTPWTLHLNRFDPRELLYALAIVGFVAAGLEQLTHLLYAQAGNPVGYGLWVGLFGVVLFAQGVPVAFVCVVWWALRHRVDDWIISRAWWAPIEIATGFSALLLLGAGFFLGPVAIMLAGIVRCRELWWDRTAPPPPPGTNSADENIVLVAPARGSVPFLSLAPA